MEGRRVDMDKGRAEGGREGRVRWGMYGGLCVGMEDKNGRWG